MSIFSQIGEIFGFSKKPVAALPVKKEEPTNPGVAEVPVSEENQASTLNIDSSCKEQGHDRENLSGRKWGIELTFNGSFVNMYAICLDCIEALRQDRRTDVLYSDQRGFVAAKFLNPAISQGVNREINYFYFLGDDETAFQQWAEKLPMEQIAAKKKELLLERLTREESGSIECFYAEAKAKFAKAKALMSIAEGIKYDLSDGGQLIISVEAKNTQQVAEYCRPSPYTKGIAVAFTTPDGQGRRVYHMYDSNIDGTARKIKEVLLEAEPSLPEGETSWYTYAGYYCADYAIGSPKCGSLLTPEEVVGIVKKAI